MTLYFLCNNKSFSLYHSVKYKNHSAGYIFHTVKYKYRSVIQRKHQQKRKKMQGQNELYTRPLNKSTLCLLYKQPVALK